MRALFISVQRKCLSSFRVSPYLPPAPTHVVMKSYSSGLSRRQQEQLLMRELQRFSVNAKPVRGCSHSIGGSSSSSSSSSNKILQEN